MDHRRPALEIIRSIVDDRSRGRGYHHRLMDYNNDPRTSFSDVQSLFREALRKTSDSPLASRARLFGQINSSLALIRKRLGSTYFPARSVQPERFRSRLATIHLLMTVLTKRSSQILGSGAISLALALHRGDAPCCRLRAPHRPPAGLL